jgi:hypothetical protein
VSFVPLASGLALGGCLYSRDLSSYFFPVRHFVVEGLRAGEICHWNPYVNEGVPVSPPPVAYPVDALQALVPSPWGFSLLLALHVPLAALTFVGLARRLGSGPAAATLGALVYALSGFSLSCINLYVHVEALAWAPLAISLLIRASSGAGREVALAAASVGLCLSTTGVEIAAQAVFCAFVLTASLSIRKLARFAASVLLGTGLAASPLLLLGGLVASGRRSGGLAITESLQNSVHPLSLLQSVIAGLFGDPIAAGTSYWGTRIWGEYPYIISLYLGGTVWCLAAIGAIARGRHRHRLVLLLGIGLLVCLGAWARLDLLLELAPVLTRFRYPVKAFYTVLVAVALLASAAVDRLGGSRRAWWALALGTTLVGAALACFSVLVPWSAATFSWLQARLFADSFGHALRAAALRTIAADSLAGAVALAATAGIAALTLARRMTARAAVVAVVAVVAADLLRAGAGLNPTAQASLYGYSPEITRVAAGMRQSGGRAFTCAVQAMPTYRDAVRGMGRRAGIWTIGLWRETLSPYANMGLRVPTTGFDATAFTSSQHSLTTRQTVCGDPQTLARLHESGVRYILSVQPFSNEALRLVDVATSARTLPLSIYVYELEDSLADPTVWSTPNDLDASGRGRALDGARARYVDERSDSVRLAVETPRSAFVIVRRANAPGWSASVNGAPATLLTANGRHQAVRVPAGVSEVFLRYRPPHARLGLTAGLASAFVVAFLWLRSRGADSRPARTS